MEILAFSITSSLVVLGFIWYANESRKLAQSMRIAALDYAIDPNDRRPAYQDVDRANVLHKWLADEPPESRVIPIRQAETEAGEDPEFGAMA